MSKLWTPKPAHPCSSEKLTGKKKEERRKMNDESAGGRMELTGWFTSLIFLTISFSFSKARPVPFSFTHSHNLTTMRPEVEIALSILAYSACSGSLVLINKLILHQLKYPSLVVCFQLASSVVFVFWAKLTKFLPVDDLVMEHIIPYLYYIAAFSAGVYCNMKSLSLSNVETVVVFRALSPCLVSILDALFLGREYPSPQSWAALFLIVVGAYGYASCDEEFQTQGVSAYMWPTAYLLIICFEMAYGKKIIKSVDLKTLSGPVLYTNLLGLPPMLFLATLGNEYSRFYSEHISVTKEALDNPDVHPFTIGLWALIFLGCVGGTGIGYSAWWCRDKVSATTFTLVGVINKCLTILVNFFIWDQHAKPMGIAFLGLCLIGGTMYRQAPMRKTEQEKSAESENIQLLEAKSEDHTVKV